MTEATPVVLTGQEMFNIRQAALSIALAAKDPLDQTAKILVDASAYLNFLLNGVPSDTVTGYITAPQPNTPEVLAAAGGVQEAAPAKKTRTKLTTVPTGTATVVATLPVQTAPAAQAAASAPATAAAGLAASPSIVPAPTTLQAAADSLKALVQDEARGGRVAAVALLTAFGVAQLNQIPAARLADFKAALDNAGKTAPAAAVVAGSDLL